MAVKKSVKHKTHAKHTTHTKRATHHRREKAVSNNWMYISVIALVIMSVVYIFANYSVSDIEMSKLPESPEVPQASTQSTVTYEEKAMIDQWITENNLNKFGDPLDTAYTGGTPLFDEKTGTYQDLYDYIVNNHPDRPWKQ